MDPTAPKKNQSGNGQNSPIQPGQFVVAGDESTPENNPTPQNPPQFPQPEPHNQAPLPNQPPQSQPTPAPTPEEPPKPVEGFTLAGESSQQPQVDIPDPNTVSESSSMQQPDPTPFAPQNMEQPPQAQTSSQGSKIDILKKFAVILAILLLIGIIAAVAWFFLLNNKSKKSAVTGEEQIIQEEPSPSPNTANNGFGKLPQPMQEATGGATNGSSLPKNSPGPPNSGL